MKKLTSAFLAAMMVLSLSVPSFAADAEQNPNKVQLSESPTSAQNFNEYISSLNPRQAQLILNDEELTEMMRRDNYWAPQTRSATPRAGSLPLPAYPSGSFYTANGQACTDHSFCELKTPPEIIGEKCYNSSTKKAGNCKIYAGTGAMQRICRLCFQAI